MNTSKSSSSLSVALLQLSLVAGGCQAPDSYSQPAPSVAAERAALQTPGTCSAALMMVTLDPAATAPLLTLAPTNLTVKTYTQQQRGSARATESRCSGKWYFEVSIDPTVQPPNPNNQPSFPVIGVGTASAPISGRYLGEDAAGWAYDPIGQGRYYDVAHKGVIPYGGPAKVGDVIGVAMDLDGGTLTFYKNGVSQGTAFSGLPLKTPLFPMIGSAGMYFTATARFSPPFASSPPAGFAPFGGIPPVIYTQLQNKATALLASGFPLGALRQGITPSSDRVGYFSVYDGAKIYWSPTTGAHEVHGAVLNKWASLGAELGLLGYPGTDERPISDGVGRYHDFQHGTISWSPPTGAHEVHGAILDKWGKLDWERSYLGYPVSDEYGCGSGRCSDFQHGTIGWTAAGGITLPIPPGNYVASCRNISVGDGSTLHAECKNYRDQWLATQLVQFGDCLGQIFNGDGQLHCSKGALPPTSGSYLATCFWSYMVDAHTLSASCQDCSQQLGKATFLDLNTCAQGVYNDGGTLRCDGGSRACGEHGGTSPPACTPRLCRQNCHSGGCTDIGRFCDSTEALSKVRDGCLWCCGDDCVNGNVCNPPRQ